MEDWRRGGGGRAHSSSNPHLSLHLQVSWQVRNNHGGGYSYRICPASEPLTEACFQSHPLDMIPEKSELQFNDGARISYKPMMVTEGTQPAGSMWARIPIAPTKLGPMCIPGPGDNASAPYSCANQNNPKSDCGCEPCPQTPGSDCRSVKAISYSRSFRFYKCMYIHFPAVAVTTATASHLSHHLQFITGLRCRELGQL